MSLLDRDMHAPRHKQSDEYSGTPTLPYIDNEGSNLLTINQSKLVKYKSERKGS